MMIVRSYSPTIEVYSIDESFLSLNGLSGLWASPTAMGQDIRGRILQWTNRPVCVGIGSSKTLALCKARQSHSQELGQLDAQYLRHLRDVHGPHSLHLAT